ncbi:Sodium/hydrogen exchanger OS=Tsukamurella paurometabola (strain ATCC 8368 / DSM / CCUG 35730/ CIP 100753 / JCM 10117 / KCTC 9821 / NBRC 16120 / NCIMB 702349/ NCTC 13040) OX=521096 GN=Tpau_1375 PE=4 SV=1 [Tsukamurella paurometabola]|uniref:Sodium/hydrogen exchanger n=1 Tax=Tsukamurella paurometabola (strain ATCC 8368 / DSM 20162 / CCUG 35730 / CIP 100753 / JCM 10117 / KCTC 9821 / NBRC 16120 / NCIMB 702349 / NCTC 13040) TaxID=521096 RepID=D5UWY1_TSUPD|nr:cation:proton antiporter [Tsukamurella paurometabola]ADG78003.1 sodium/hydrogen exchanger [Tsukamurella paurometabola DSM 20162]SUP29738.1 potassium/proton antiporter [Tsukamurella paurometabola]
MIAAILVATSAFIVWCLLANRMERWWISAPLVMVLAGGAVGIGAHGAITMALNTTAAQRAAEIILAVLLFVDATEVRGSLLGRYPRLAARGLFIGIPVSLAMTMLVGWFLLPRLGWSVLLLVACVIAPIDFASAPSLLRDRHVPERVRDVLTVESGYTDGLVTPVFLFALLWADPANDSDDPIAALVNAAPSSLTALAVGVVMGLVVETGLVRSDAAGWSTERSRRLALVATPLVTYAAAVGLGGNGFVAAFVCGIVYRFRRGSAANSEVGLTEDVGSLLTAAMWFVFGAVTVIALADGLPWQVLAFAAIALTVLRVLPEAVAVTGSGLPRSEVLALGWLRPRGTSTIVFALIAFNTLPDGDAADLILTLATLVVLGSIVLHTVGAPVAVAGHDRRVRRRAGD